MAKLGREPRKRRGRAPKEAAVAHMVGLLESGQGFLLLRNKGLTYGQATELRAKAREQKVAIKVMKNTLFKHALRQTNVDPEPFDQMLKKETMVVIGLEDPVTPAKLVADFVKAHEEKIEVKGGYFDGQVLDPSGVETLATIPPREILLQRLLGSFLSPVQKTAFALNAIAGKPVYLLDALRRKKEEAGEAA